MNAPGQAVALSEAERPPDPSRSPLRTRLLWHLMPALLLSWVLGSAVALYTAAHFTQQAYDRSMLDDAQLVDQHLRERQGALVLEASDDDLNAILYDPKERIYFAVRSAGGQLIAGHSGLRLPLDLDDSEVQYTDLQLGRTRLKAVVLTRDRPLPHKVIVAVTTGSRDKLLSRLLVVSIVPQAVLLLGLALWLRRVIRLELQPLVQLQESVEQRDSADLSPLPLALTSHAVSKDVQSLSTAIDGLLRRVDRSMGAQREFAGNVAHELRTPLAGVRAAAEYGLAQGQADQWREQLHAVLRSEQRASHLVEQLLSLALANESSASLSLAPLRLNEVVREGVLGWLPRTDQLGIELVASGLDEDTLVLADRALVEGVLGNLLDNALRYGLSPGGGSSISVVISHVAGEVWLSVIDQGPGIPADQRAMLRNRWMQGETGTRIGVGAGLGLSICERFAQLMRARLVLGSGMGGVGLCASLVFGHAADLKPPAPGNRP